MNSYPPVAIIDNAVKRPSLNCFNRLVDHFDLPFTYHSPPTLGLESLKKSDPSAYILFGSASNLSERLDWQLELQDFIKEKIKKGIPTLGLCFGHQLVAEAFGCTVAPRSDGLWEGVRELSIQEDYFGFSFEDSFTLIQTHEQEVVSISDEFLHLGKSDDCLYDALALKNHSYIGFQGHAEASDEFLEFDLKIKIDQKESSRAQKDGLNLIEKFLTEVEKKLRD